MAAVVEFHGFKDNDNRFIVKELAIVGRNFQSQIVFKSPFSFYYLNSKMRRTARWLTRNFHHIKWDDTGVPYDEQIIRDLCKTFKVIYTKGLEKAEFLREFHHNVREIDWDRGEPGEVQCLLPQHRGSSCGRCALQSAKSFLINL
jgi:hypothetical protein